MDQSFLAGDWGMTSHDADAEAADELVDAVIEAPAGAKDGPPWADDGTPGMDGGG